MSEFCMPTEVGDPEHVVFWHQILVKQFQYRVLLFSIQQATFWAKSSVSLKIPHKGIARDYSETAEIPTI